MSLPEIADLSVWRPRESQVVVEGSRRVLQKLRVAQSDTFRRLMKEPLQLGDPCLQERPVGEASAAIVAVVARAHRLEEDGVVGLQLGADKEVRGIIHTHGRQHQVFIVSSALTYLSALPFFLTASSTRSLSALRPSDANSKA